MTGGGAGGGLKEVAAAGTHLLSQGLRLFNELIPDEYADYTLPILLGVLLSGLLTMLGLVGVVMWYIERTVSGYRSALEEAAEATKQAEAVTARVREALLNATGDGMAPGLMMRSPAMSANRSPAVMSRSNSRRVEEAWFSGAVFAGEWRVDKDRSDPLDGVMDFLGYGPDTIVAANQATVSHTIACEDGMITLRDWEMEGNNEATSYILSRDSDAPRVISRIFMDRDELVQEESHPDTGHILTVRRSIEADGSMVAVCRAEVVGRGQGRGVVVSPECRRIFARIGAGGSAAASPAH